MHLSSVDEAPGQAHSWSHSPIRKGEKREKKKNKKKEEKEKGHSRRNKRKSKAATGVVQTFKAKNVPKDRLTLDPGTKFGLYTKGRSSGPTKSKGLPDLVFSEMRFLQKPESSTKEESDQKPKKKLHKKKRHQLSEREISSWSESGEGSSARMAHFVQDLEPLAVGQLQGGRAQQQMEAVLHEQDTAQHRSVERIIPGQHSKSQDPIHEPAQEIGQTTRLPVKLQTNQGVDTETMPMPMPMPISEKHKHSVPAATTLVNQSERECHSGNRTLPADEAMPTIANDNCRTETTEPERAANPVKQYSEPWEELLQNCELAARPPVRTYYDEELPRYDSPAIRSQHPLDIYSHAGPPLWRADADHFPEYDYANNAAFMSEQEHWAQPVATEYQDDIVPFLGEIRDETSESLDSQDDYELATEDAVECDIDDAERYDEVQNCQIRDGEAMDDFAMFWQPNKLY
ncbi:hypothetical protein KCV07_g3821, partial [Aureobasidium melanogenum]